MGLPPRDAEKAMELVLLSNRSLQLAVRSNLVCFPSQAPVFGKHSRRDIQWRLAVLYFIRGWPTRAIARRYGLTRERCGQLISDWRIRAVNMGYIQDITPDEACLYAAQVSSDSAGWNVQPVLQGIALHHLPSD